VLIFGSFFSSTASNVCLRLIVWSNQYPWTPCTVNRTVQALLVDCARDGADCALRNTKSPCSVQSLEDWAGIVKIIQIYDRRSVSRGRAVVISATPRQPNPHGTWQINHYRVVFPPTMTHYRNVHAPLKLSRVVRQGLPCRKNCIDHQTRPLTIGHF
jgi:hypothetical protein